MAEPVYVVNNGSGDLTGLFFIPPLILPGYFVYKTWVALSALQWHPVFKLAATGGEIAVVFYALMLFYSYVPPLISIGLSAVYMGATYGWVIAHFGADPIWTGAVVVIAGTGGFFLGRTMARDLSGKRAATA